MTAAGRAVLKSVLFLKGASPSMTLALRLLAVLGVLCRGDVGPEADSARREARATSRSAVLWDRLLGQPSAALPGRYFSLFLQVASSA